MTPTFGEPFRGFRDHSESPFFRAPGHSPEETWELSVDRLAQMLVALGPLAAAGPIEMSAELLCSWHRDIFSAIYAATRLYAKLLRAHPWIDGNLRAGVVAFNAGLLTLGLPRVQFKDLELHDDLLGIAFVGKHEPYRPLAEQIATIISNTDPA